MSLQIPVQAVADKPIYDFHSPKFAEKKRRFGNSLFKEVKEKCSSHGHGHGHAHIIPDGFDEAANALQGSGLSRELVLALQAFVFYPIILPLVAMGFSGARGEFAEARHERSKILKSIQKARENLRQFMTESGITIDDQKDEAKFIADLFKKIPSLSAEKKPRFYDLLLTYKHYLDQKFGSAIKAFATTPMAMVGTGGMLAGVGLYEAEALTSFFGGSASVAEIFGSIANIVMPVGQIAMAGYGLGIAYDGYKSIKKLNNDLRRVTESEILDKDVKDQIADHLKAKKKLIQWGKVFAGILLAIGQVFMAVGFLVPGFGLPFLISGACLTIAAIAIKIGCEHLYKKRFSYDQKALSLEFSQNNDMKSKLERITKERKKAITALQYIKQQKQNQNLYKRPDQKYLCHQQDVKKIVCGLGYDGYKDFLEENSGICSQIQKKMLQKYSKDDLIKSNYLSENKDDKNKASYLFEIDAFLDDVDAKTVRSDVEKFFEESVKESIFGKYKKATRSKLFAANDALIRLSAIEAELHKTA